MKADFHIHSTISDGSDDIEHIISDAIYKGLHAIAFTEHDTLSHLKHLPERSDIQIFGGIEISAVHPETNIRAHILGYNIKDTEHVTAMTQPLLEARNRNSEKQADILARHGYAIDMQKLPRADGRYLYKQHIMDWLVSTQQVQNMFGDFYRSVFKNGGICSFDILYIDVFKAVKTIKEAGGLAVLAHPGQQQNFWLIPELVGVGLDGIELSHHGNSEVDKSIVKSFADEHGLFLTGGSDYHGRYEPQPVGIGDYLSEESGVMAICQM